MIFANLFAITSTPQHIQDVKEMVLSLLEDEQLEVLCIVLYMKLTEIVTIQMKASEQCFSVMLFIMLYKVVLTVEFMDKILRCDHSNESYYKTLFSCAAHCAAKGGSNVLLSLWMIIIIIIIIIVIIIIGARARRVLERMQKSVISNTLNIARTFKINT